MGNVIRGGEDVFGRRVGHDRIVLSVNLARRVLISLAMAPLWVFALSGFFEGDPAALPFSLMVGVMSFVLWLLTRYRIEVTDEGLSRVTVFGRRNIPWSRVRSIGVAPGGVTVLDEAGKYIVISSWFLDGYPVLAEVLIARVTASVLEKSGGRSLLERQAAAARR